MTLTTLFKALFNPNIKPQVKWNNPDTQPACNISFIVMNVYGGINTEIRIGEWPFKFNNDDVSWCYLHEFKQLLPEFLRCRVSDFMPGVHGTKTTGVYNVDAGGDFDNADTGYNAPGVLADWDDALLSNTLDTIGSQGYNKLCVLADWDDALIHNDIFNGYNLMNIPAVINPELFESGFDDVSVFDTNFIIVKFGYNAPGVLSDWDLAIYINNLKHVQLATDLRMGALERELNSRILCVVSLTKFCDLVFRNRISISDITFKQLRNQWINGNWNE
ncbi:hypothetical protein S144_75 [Shewanella sp. phage 1/44]|uniref:hypothetical protein n=1 Tax=Shewanella sp. phage 1/44 TaxID=1458862 RepID=UPI0004F7B66B|nr:hypothetical protein S144_75 [Shewanella sp. phage 1/44]AHK11789.1 hypothetical protein S144_75 [Shewanella sp. phage 1/44]